MEESIGAELDEFGFHREQASDDRRDQLIRKAHGAGINIRQIAMRMGISRTTVYRVLGIAPADDAEHRHHFVMVTGGMACACGEAIGGDPR